MGSGMCELKQILQGSFYPAHRHLSERIGRHSVPPSDAINMIGPVTLLGDRPWSYPHARDF
jgi:hypothetical protein